MKVGGGLVGKRGFQGLQQGSEGGREDEGMKVTKICLKLKN